MEIIWKTKKVIVILQLKDLNSFRQLLIKEDKENSIQQKGIRLKIYFNMILIPQTFPKFSVTRN